MDELIPIQDILRMLSTPSAVQTGSAFIIGTQAKRIVVASFMIISSIASLVTLVSFMMNHPKMSSIVFGIAALVAVSLSTGCSSLSSTQSEVDTRSEVNLLNLSPSFGGSHVCGEALFALREKTREVNNLVEERKELKDDFDSCRSRSKSMLFVNPFNNFRRNGNE